MSVPGQGRLVLDSTFPVWEFTRTMLLREVIASSGLTLRDLARQIGCSPQHLLQAAQLKRSLGPELVLRVKRFNPSFSMEAQVAAFCAARAGDQAKAPNTS